MLTEDEVKHLAVLARIKLTPEEEKLFQKQLSGILDYMDILNELETDGPIPGGGGQAGVLETSQVIGLENVMEKDEIKPSQSEPGELLDCSELPKDSDQIRVQSVKK